MGTILTRAIDNDQFSDAAAIIAENNEDIINQPDADGVYPIHLVTDFSLYPELDVTTREELNTLALLLINKGANISSKHEGLMPIHYAAYNGNLDVFNALVTMGADFRAADDSGFMPLYYARQRGHQHIVDRIHALQAAVQWQGPAILPNFNALPPATKETLDASPLQSDSMTDSPLPLPL